MARPPLPLGTPGQIRLTEDRPKVWIARCRFRDHDGVTRQLKAHGSTKASATSRLHRTIQDRQRGRGGAGGPELTPASTFADAAGLYLAKIERKREDSTLALYRFHLDGTVLPGLGALRLREYTVARIDASLDALAPRYAASTRRTFRSIVSGVL